MPFIDVQDGVRIHAQDLGQGPPVLLLAGFGLHHEVWDGQVRLLANAGRRPVCVDLRGTGHSDKPIDGYDIDRLVRDVELVLEQLELHDVTIVGHSFGGQIGLRLAAGADNGRVRRLVLVCSNGVRASRSDAFPFGPRAEGLQAALVAAEERDRIASRSRNVRSAFHAEPQEELVAWLTRMQLQMPSWAAVPCYGTYLHTDLTADLDALSVPVLQLMGVQDPVSSIKGAAWVQERLADGHLIAFEECGHYPMFEAPEAFDSALLEWTADP